MKRGLLWSLWAFLPLVALAIHFGPGQVLWAKDQAAGHISAAEQARQRAKTAEDGQDWLAAAEQYAAARVLLPEDDIQGRAKLELAEAKARLEGGELVEAVKQLEVLFEKQSALPNPDQSLLKDARAAIAEGAYYSAWTMRLEGASADEWKPETEKARQHYRYLAESATGEEATKYKENLETTIRLEQMDLSELQSLPLPKKCKNCSNCSQKKRQQRLSQCKDGKQPQDARKEANKSGAQEAKTGKGS